MFKNITNPIPIWHVAAESSPTPTRPPMPVAAKPAAGRRWQVAVTAAALALAAIAVWLWSQRAGGPEAATGVGTAKVPATPKSETQKLVDRARTLFTESNVIKSKLDAAVAVAEQALKLEPTNADALAIASQLDSHLLMWGKTSERSSRARNRSEQATNLAPEGIEPRIARAWFLVVGLGQPQSTAAEADLLKLRQQLPDDWRVCWLIARLRESQGRLEEYVEILGKGEKIAGWAIVCLSQRAIGMNYLGRYAEAEQTIDRSVTGDPQANCLAFKATMELAWRGNLAGALATASKMAVTDQFDHIGMATFERVYRWRREPANVVKFLSQDAREWIEWDVGAPKAALRGEAYHALGQPDSAREEWQLALKQIEARLADTPNDRNLLEWKA